MIKRNLPKPGCACAAARIAVILCMTAVLCLAAWGCVRTLNLNGQKKNVEYVICKDSNLPDQLKTLLEEKKKNPGTFTYRNSRYIYLVVCYGKRAYSGYSVKIEECWRSEETLFLRTQLMGPAAGEDIVETDTYPYIVVRCQQMYVFCLIED